MSDFLDFRTALIVFLGLIVPVTRVLGMLARRRSEAASNGHALRFPAGLVMGTLGWLGCKFGETVPFEINSDAWLLLGAGSMATWFATLPSRSERTGLCLREVVSPVMQGAGVIVAGPLVAFSLAWTPIDNELPDDFVSGSINREKLVTAGVACTDQGRAIKLYTSKADAHAPRRLYNDREVRALEERKILEVAKSDASHNCFGWVFADGRFIISDQDVLRILEDNQYQLVTEPRADDVVIYRDTTGKIVHAGRVTQVSAACVMVESKWGLFSRFLHPVGDSAYHAEATYYRTVRGGHSLCGMPERTVPADLQVVTTAWSRTLSELAARLASCTSL